MRGLDGIRKSSVSEMAKELTALCYTPDLIVLVVECFDFVLFLSAARIDSVEFEL